MRFTGAHKVTAIVILCAVFSLSCVHPTDPGPVAAAAEAPVEEPIEEPTPEPAVEAWQPEPATLYLFYDEPGGELYFSQVVTADRWASRVRAFRQMEDKYGYVFVAGTPPEEA